jgi:methionyl-tRNA formyltransferase
MDSFPASKPVKKIAILAKHPFYVEDIRAALTDLDVELYHAEDLGLIDEYAESGTEFDFVFFPHYSRIVPRDFLEKYFCIGFHTGDLPMDRGGSPIQNKILRGEYSTWVSALRLIEEIDAGDILCQQPISLQDGSIEEILRKISLIIADLIRLILTQRIQLLPQLGGGQYFPRLQPKDSEIRLENLNLRQIYDRIRMLDGLDYPSAYLLLGGHRLILSKAILDDTGLAFRAELKE